MRITRSRWQRPQFKLGESDPRVGAVRSVVEAVRDVVQERCENRLDTVALHARARHTQPIGRTGKAETLRLRERVQQVEPRGPLSEEGDAWRGIRRGGHPNRGRSRRFSLRDRGACGGVCGLGSAAACCEHRTQQEGRAEQERRIRAGAARCRYCAQSRIPSWGGVSSEPNLFLPTTLVPTPSRQTSAMPFSFARFESSTVLVAGAPPSAISMP